MHSGSKTWYNSLWASVSAGHNDERSIEEGKPTDGWLLAHGATLIETARVAELRQRQLHC